MKTHILIPALTAAFLLVAGCKKVPDKTADAARQTPEVAVAVPEVDSVTLHKTYPGFIAADTKVDVVGRVSGTLRSINFKGGDFVTQGQVLFTIENTTYADAVQRAKASLENALSQRQYCAERLTAMEKAYASNAVSKMDVSGARNNLAQAEADISTARAALRDAQTNLGYCTVRAPGSGYITKPNLDPGNFVGGAASPVVLATIYDSRKVTAAFSIEDSQFEQMVGDKGTSSPLYRNIPLRFQENLPHSYTCDLYYTAPNVDKNTGTLLMKGVLDNPYDELKDGMFVSVDLPYGTDPRAILVKSASISTDQRGQFLYVVDEDDKVQYRPVTVGQTVRDSLSIIEKGLQPGERYVTEALLTVRPGMSVKPRLVKTGL